MSKLSHSSAEALLVASRRFNRVGFSQSKTMATGDLSRADWHFMWLLGNEFAVTGARPSEIARRLRVTAGNVAQQLRHLEAKQLLVRTQDEDDRRAVLIKLTPAGEIKLQDVRNEYVSEFARLTAHLGKQDTEELIRLLSLAATYLEKPELSPC